MSETLRAVDEKRDWLRRVLGIDPARGTTSEPPGLRGQLNELGLRLRELSATPGFTALAKRFAQGVAALKAGDWSTVAAALEEIEPQITGALSGARGDEAAEVVRAARAWRDACAQVADAIAAFKATLIATLRAEDEHEPEELDEVRDELDARLDPIVARLSTGLADQVDAAINAAGERRAKAMQQVLERIGQTEAALRGDETIAIVEDNGLQPIGIAAPALTALAELRTVLAARAARA